MNLAHKEWAAAMADMGAKMADLNEHLERDGVWSSPKQEFHRLLTLGDVSPGMHLYLTATLGEQPARPFLFLTSASSRMMCRVLCLRGFWRLRMLPGQASTRLSLHRLTFCMIQGMDE
jgi:hypothetical protein